MYVKNEIPRLSFSSQLIRHRSTPRLHRVVKQTGQEGLAFARPVVQVRHHAHIHEKEVGRAERGQSTSGGRCPKQIYGATLGKAGAPPKVDGWVREEWKGGGACPPEQA